MNQGPNRANAQNLNNQQAGGAQQPPAQNQGGQQQSQPSAAAQVNQNTEGGNQQLPEDSRERTREQFEKLLDSNKRLYEANEMLRKEMEQRREPQTPATQYPQQTPQYPQQPAQQQVNPQDFVERDPVTGEPYINEAKLRSRIEEIQRRATKAEETVQKYIKTAEEREIERQNKEAFDVYPELEPGADNFDSRFHKQVRGVLYDSMLNADEYGGRPLSFKEAADFVRQGGQAPASAPSKEEQEAKRQEQSQEAQALKEQSSAQADSQPQNAPPAYEPEEMQVMRMRTRLGDDEALARRILNTDHMVRDEEGGQEG